MIRLINFLIDQLYTIKRFLTQPWKRSLKHVRQRFTQGFPDSDTWSLDWKIAQYVLPRLQRFKELNNGYPGDLAPETWDAMLDDMIYAMSYVAEDDASEEQGYDMDRVKVGLKLFGERLPHLWW